MTQQLNFQLATDQCLDEALEDTQFHELLDWLSSDPAVSEHIPEQTCQLDPRDGSLVVYNATRADRLHDNVAGDDGVDDPGRVCPICRGQMTRILDIAPLSEGFTFISQNLYPILNPAPRLADDLLMRAMYPDPLHHGRVAYGMHLLQWTSSIHDRDWHNMAVADLAIVLSRLAHLEKCLVKGAHGYMPLIDQRSDSFGSFSVIKNWGADAGASLSHGHQQIAFSNIMPQRAFSNWSFYRRHKRTFSQYLLAENPEELSVAEWERWRLIVPYFMQRPLSMMLLYKGEGVRHLFQLDKRELVVLGEAMQLAIRALQILIPTYYRPAAFNFAIHNGPDSDVYVEFFPVTQTLGGFERLGMWVCQERPIVSAAKLRRQVGRL